MSLITQEPPVQRAARLPAGRTDSRRLPPVTADQLAVAMAVLVAIATFVLMAFTAV